MSSFSNNLPNTSTTPYHPNNIATLPPRPPKTYLTTNSASSLQGSFDNRNNLTLPRNLHAGADLVIRENSDEDGGGIRHMRASSVSCDRRTYGDVTDSPTTPSSQIKFLDDPLLVKLTNELAARAPSWADTQEKKVLKTFPDKKLIKRYNFIYELITTEISHLRNLVVLRTIFRDTFLSTGCLDRQTISSLFPSLDEMDSLHSSFLEDLRKCDPPVDLNPKEDFYVKPVGPVVHQHLSNKKWLSVYGNFCSMHKVYLQKEVMKLSLKIPHFGSVLKECERSPQAGRKTLLDYYLVLTQRLSKYKSLLPRISELADIQPKETKIAEATVLLETLMTDINAEVEKKENASLLDDVINGLSQPTAVLTPAFLRSRKIVHCGPLRVILPDSKPNEKPTKCLLLLLNDSLVFLQEQSSNSGTSKFTPLLTSAPNFEPVVSFRVSNPIVREDDSAKSRVNFFIIVSDPKPFLYHLICHAADERTKWINKINEVRGKNPVADIKTAAEEQKLNDKKKTANELLIAMETKDKDIFSSMNAKNQLWQQLLNVWNCSADGFAFSPVSRGTSTSSINIPADGSTSDDMHSSTTIIPQTPEVICTSALREISKLRLLLHVSSGGAPSSLTRSASNAEEKASGVSLPKRAETFAGYDARTTPTPSPVPPQPSEPEDSSSNKMLIQQATQAASTPPTGASTNHKMKSGFYASMRKEKSRRPSVFDNIFRRANKDRNSVSEESGSEPELRAPETSSLATLDRLACLVENLSKALLMQQTTLCRVQSQEQELRRKVEILVEKSADSPSQHSKGSALEMIRSQRAELEKDRAKWKNEKEKEKSRLEYMREDLEQREKKIQEHGDDMLSELHRQQKLCEEALRQKEEAVKKAQENLEEHRKVLQKQAELYNYTANLDDPCVASPTLPYHQKSLSVETTAASLLLSKAQSKSTNNLNVMSSNSLPAHLASKVNQERYNSSTSLDVKLPMHLASDGKKHKGKVPLIMKLQGKTSGSDGT